MLPWRPPCWMIRASIWIHGFKAFKLNGILGHSILLMFVISLQSDNCMGTLSLAFFSTFKQITDTDLAYTSDSLVLMMMEIYL